MSPLLNIYQTDLCQIIRVCRTMGCGGNCRPDGNKGSLPTGLWLTSPAGSLPRTGISSRTLRFKPTRCLEGAQHVLRGIPDDGSWTLCFFERSWVLLLVCGWSPSFFLNDKSDNEQSLWNTDTLCSTESWTDNWVIISGPHGYSVHYISNRLCWNNSWDRCLKYFLMQKMRFLVHDDLQQRYEVIREAQNYTYVMFLKSLGITSIDW